MLKKLMIIGAAAVLVLAVALVAAGDSGDAVACKDQAKASTASSSCSGKAATAAGTKSASACARSAAAAACCPASGKAAVAGYTKAECGEKAHANAAALGEITDEIPYREAKRLVVVGTMACGSCTYKKTASCAPLVKTEDGKVYPLVKNHMIKRMHQAETEQGFELSTRVRKFDGVKYLEVVSFRSL
ncbi:MAG: hypothetical protein OEO21_12560 [Candidatus Krumholzibacteria bacterium]|nr:hypothetical protein [Candidatus Krumholzibacteria bacterium]